MCAIFLQIVTFQPPTKVRKGSKVITHNHCKTTSGGKANVNTMCVLKEHQSVAHTYRVVWSLCSVMHTLMK